MKLTKDTCDYCDHLRAYMCDECGEYVCVGHHEGLHYFRREDIYQHLKGYDCCATCAVRHKPKKLTAPRSELF